jgi:hypothetical protein
LAASLIGSAVAKRFVFQNKQSPSLERRWEEDCGRINRMVPYEQKGFSFSYQLFYQNPEQRPKILRGRYRRVQQRLLHEG